MYSILTMMVQFDDTMYSINVPVCMISMYCTNHCLFSVGEQYQRILANDNLTVDKLKHRVKLANHVIIM